MAQIAGRLCKRDPKITRVISSNRKSYDRVNHNRVLCKRKWRDVYLCTPYDREVTCPECQKLIDKESK